jgi:dephospho-CoA kinase
MKGSDRAVALITGMSGTGKSAVLAELAGRGHRVVDTDDPGWKLQSHTAEGPEPVWECHRIGALLDAHLSGSLFIGGCVANQGLFYDRFDAVVLLSAPLAVLFARVVERPNPYGATSADRAKIANDVAAYEERLRAGADYEIVTTTSVAEVADRVEKLIQS